MADIRIRIPLTAASPATEEAHEADSPVTVSYWVLIVLFGCGILAAVVRYYIQTPVLHWLTVIPAVDPVLEHISSALIVAAVIGLSYERILHKHREATFKRLFQEHRIKTFEALSAYLSLRPGEIFTLMRDIIVQAHQTTGKIPTLYDPPRADNQEYTFAESSDFETIVTVGRKEVVEVLKTWLAPKSPVSLKFLASDFVGRYHLVELRDFLFVQAQEKLNDWKRLSPEEHWWTLNYFWAASRCENPRYYSLSNLISNTAVPEIREWILFVPQQMNDPELLHLIKSFLKRPDQPSPQEIKLVVRALAEFWTEETRKSITKLFDTYQQKFKLPEVADEVWSRFGHLNPAPHDLLKRFRRPK